VYDALGGIAFDQTIQQHIDFIPPYKGDMPETRESILAIFPVKAVLMWS
jgi:hypothetical protein